jgi:transposase
LDTRRVLSGILFVLKTGIAWDALPAELGWGCGKTCRSYLRRWQRAGVWQKLHEVLLAELHEADQIDWSRAVADSGSVRAPQGGAATGPSPTDRRKLGSKHHVIVDAQGIPLAATTTGAQRHDVTQLTTLVDRIPPVRGKRGRPRRRPKRLQGDRAYDSEPHRRELRRRGIQPVLARRRTPHGSGLGKHRWVVERTLAWLHQHGRLRRRTDRLPQIHNAFLSLASALICLNFLPP